MTSYRYLDHLGVWPGVMSVLSITDVLSHESIMHGCLSVGLIASCTFVVDKSARTILCRRHTPLPLPPVADLSRRLCPRTVHISSPSIIYEPRYSVTFDTVRLPLEESMWSLPPHRHCLYSPCGHLLYGLPAVDVMTAGPRASDRPQWCGCRTLYTIPSPKVLLAVRLGPR